MKVLALSEHRLMNWSMNKSTNRIDAAESGGSLVTDDDRATGNPPRDGI